MEQSYAQIQEPSFMHDDYVIMMIQMEATLCRCEQVGILIEQEKDDEKMARNEEENRLVKLGESISKTNPTHQRMLSLLSLRDTLCDVLKAVITFFRESDSCEMNSENIQQNYSNSEQVIVYDN